jgi:hypothetical protein
MLAIGLERRSKVFQALFQGVPGVFQGAAGIGPFHHLSRGD